MYSNNTATSDCLAARIPTAARYSPNRSSLNFYLQDTTSSGTLIMPSAQIVAPKSRAGGG